MNSQSHPYPEKSRLPFILYPPAMWENKSGNTGAMEHLGLNESAGDYVMYLSVPFCRVRCKACPYFIRTLAESDPGNMEEKYIDAMLKDLRRWSSYPRFRDGDLRAIYIGGGTGSILKTKNLKRVVDTVFENFPVADDYCVTLEGNARDYDDEKLDYVVASEITRISLGVQSFDPKVLETVGSPHAAEESVEVIDALGKRGFHNVQLDLMYNMPGHTLEVWKEDLQRLKALNIQHFTTYLYRVHADTAQFKLIQSGQVAPVRDSESDYVESMRREAVAAAEQLGYRQYMFDHFALPGHESKYNHFTFRGTRDALGIGAGAYSMINETRLGSKKSVDEYIGTVNRGEHMITSMSEKMDSRVMRERYVIFTLQYWTVEFDAYFKYFATHFMDDFGDIVRRLEAKNLLHIEQSRVSMTDLGREWKMNVVFEFINPVFWGDAEALKQPNWAMNVPMVEFVAGGRERWLGQAA